MTRLASELEALYADALPRLRPDITAGEDLEQQVLLLAYQLDPWTCETERYKLLTQQDPSLLGPIESELNALWQEYSSLEISNQEVTMESTALHRVLKRGFDEWRAAIKAARQGRWEEALDSANEANRLLIAVKMAREKLSQQMDSLGFDVDL